MSQYNKVSLKIYSSLEHCEINGIILISHTGELILPRNKHLCQGHAGSQSSVPLPCGLPTCTMFLALLSIPL